MGGDRHLPFVVAGRILVMLGENQLLWLRYLTAKVP